MQISRLKNYWRVWKLTASNALQEAFVNRASNLLFMAGKAIRLTVMLMLLLLLKNNVQTFAGYSPDQIIVFYLTYQIVDLFAQILYRGVYTFTNLMRTGEFDFYLAKPINPLFRALTGTPDINDALFLIPNIAIMIYLLGTLQLELTLTSVLLYLLLLLNSFLIVTALHIFVLCVGILTTEVDGMIWLYRDLSRLGQFPVSMYLEPLRLALFFIVPIGFMITIPAEVLTNTTPSYSIAVTAPLGIGFFILALRIWNYSLRKYSSASS